jgi:hypothetical protein
LTLPFPFHSLFTHRNTCNLLMFNDLNVKNQVAI